MTQTVNNTDTPLRFGEPSAAVTNEKFHGELDEINLFDRALDLAEIQTLFARGAITSGLVGHWNLDETAGNQAADDSGNGHHGTLAGDPAWTNLGTLGVGYDTGATYLPYFDIDVLDQMRTKQTGCYIRIPFSVADASLIDAFNVMTLKVRYDDGFVAYLNGVKIAGSNDPAAPVWNSTATTQNSDTNAVNLESFNVSNFIGELREGDNLLAIHGLNISLTSSDFLISAELSAREDAVTGEILSPSAIEYTGPLTLTGHTRLKARALNGVDWSALSEATFAFASARENVRLTEIMYNPVAPPLGSPYDNDDFEFIEFQNVGSTAVNLLGFKLTDGVAFEFGSPLYGSTTATAWLDAGAYCVIVRNRFAFESRYGAGVHVAGQYTGGLSNGGETLRVADALGAVFAEFDYNDAGDWPDRPDGRGSSLELIDPAATLQADYAAGDNWRSSPEYGGSPGRAGADPMNDIVINEVLTHTDPPLVDTIELLNVSAQPISIAGWFLSDSNNNYFKFAIPAGASLISGAYDTFDEGDFNPTPLTPGPNDFALSGSHGEDLYLMAVDGDMIRFADHIEFGGAANGESFGRWPNGQGDLYPMIARSLGDENIGPRIGPILISEVHYSPTSPTAVIGVSANDLEFVEIYNPTATPIAFAGWRLRKGVDFDFVNAGIASLAPLATLVVVPFDPASPLDALKTSTFRSAYGIDASVDLAGPYSGQLSNGGEKVQLQRPDDPPADEPLFTPHMIEDEAQYDNIAPWPLEADGGGKSLTRALSPALFGRDASAWTAEEPTPGAVATDPVGTPPTITTTPPAEVTVGSRFVYNFAASGEPAPTFTIEGLPAWLQTVGEVAITGVPGPADIGETETITITATNTAGADSQAFTIRVLPAPAPLRPPMLLLR